ncbi:hypothetical protein EJB05_28585, partial [Eragrostis curvula]
MFGRAASSRVIRRQEKGMQQFVAWSCAIATVLALATVAPVVAAGTQDDDAAAMGLKNVTGICLSTPYPSACRKALSSAGARLGGAGGARAGADPFAASMRFAMARATSARAVARNLSASTSSHLGGVAAPPSSGMDDCAELLDISVAQLGDAFAAASRDADAVTTWLSAAMTNQATCADSLAISLAKSSEREDMRARVSALAEFIGTALALHANKVKAKANTAAQSSSSPAAGDDASTALPAWLSEHDVKLLRSPGPAASGVAMDAVVALDGTGTHRSINEAIAAVTTSAKGVRGGGGGGRKVIYVKAGRYEESVNIGNKQKNVMLMGDGKGSTVIVNHKSVGDGYSTYASATVGTYHVNCVRTWTHRSFGSIVHSVVALPYLYQLTPLAHPYIVSIARKKII